RLAVVAVPERHAFERLVAFLLRPVPVQPFPVFSEQLREGVAPRQGHANAEAPFAFGLFRLYEVVSMNEIHGYRIFGLHCRASISESGAGQRQRSPAPSRSAHPSRRRVTN